MLLSSIPKETKAIVCYDYEAKKDDELTLRIGEIVRNVVKYDNGWWEGELSNQQTGYFPSNFVQEIADISDEYVSLD